MKIVYSSQVLEKMSKHSGFSVFVNRCVNNFEERPGYNFDSIPYPTYEIEENLWLIKDFNELPDSKSTLKIMFSGESF